jgi:hypothetical protein
MVCMFALWQMCNELRVRRAYWESLASSSFLPLRLVSVVRVDMSLADAGNC